MMNKAIGPIISLIVALLVLAPSAATTKNKDHAPWRLIWFAVTPTSQGPVGLKTPEATPFGTESDCVAFGRSMAPRMQDWVRGLARADWDHDVRVAFECELVGVPS